MQSENVAAKLEEVIRTRRTEKVLQDVEHCLSVPPEVAARNREKVIQSLQTAGWAPFHYPRNESDIAEPWRAHILWHEEVHRVARYLRDELKSTTKEPQLSAGCSALVMVTWLPEFYDRRLSGAAELSEKSLRRDEEHLAAAAAMVQNFLLMLTAHGMGTYWSSGGKLREAEMFEQLGISANERLLAAVYIEYPEMRDDSKQRIPGRLRDSRGDKWIREVAFG